MSLDSTSEKTRARITTQPTEAAIRSGAPVMSVMGANAAIVVSTPKVAGTATR